MAKQPQRRVPRPIQIVPPEAFHDFLFPLQGLDLSAPYGRQPAGTTPVGLNVRGCEPATGRLRGGQRPGIARFVNGQVSGTDHIQEIQWTQLLCFGGTTIPGSEEPVRAIGFSVAGPSGKVGISNGSTPLWERPASFTTGTPQVAVVANPTGGGGPALIYVDEEDEEWVIVQGGNVVASGALPDGADPASVSVTADTTAFYLTAPTPTTVTVKKLTPTGTVTWTGTYTSTPSVTQKTGTVKLTTDVYVTVPDIGILKFPADDGTPATLLVTKQQIRTAVPGYDPTGPITATGRLALVVENRPENRLGLVFVTTAGAFSPTALIDVTHDFTKAEPGQVAPDGTDVFWIIPAAGSAPPFAEVKKVNTTTGAVTWTSPAFGQQPAVSVGVRSDTAAVTPGDSCTTAIPIQLDTTYGPFALPGAGTHWFALPAGISGNHKVTTVSAVTAGSMSCPVSLRHGSACGSDSELAASNMNTPATYCTPGNVTQAQAWIRVGPDTGTPATGTYTITPAAGTC